jgi:hypothetical protein
MLAVAWVIVAMSSVAGAAVVSTDVLLDPMTGTGLLYDKGGSAYIGRMWEIDNGAYDTLDPSDHYVNSLLKADTNDNWFSYKTADGRAFNSVAVTFGRKYYGSIGLSYRVDGGSAVSIAPTSIASLGGPGNDWYSYVYTWDLSSLAALPNEVIVTMSSPQSWSVAVATAKLTAVEVPEPATMCLLAVGGIAAMRRRRA